MQETSEFAFSSADPGLYLANLQGLTRLILFRNAWFLSKSRDRLLINLFYLNPNHPFWKIYHIGSHNAMKQLYVNNVQTWSHIIWKHIDSIGLKENNKFKKNYIQNNFLQKVSQSVDQALGRVQSSRRTQRDNLLSTLLGNRQNPGRSFTFPHRNQLSNRGETWRPPNHCRCRSCHVPELGMF